MHMILMYAMKKILRTYKLINKDRKIIPFENMNLLYRDKITFHLKRHQKNY